MKDRICDSPTPKRDADGKPLCSWCGGALPKGRRSWCSQACVDDYLVRRSPAVARAKVGRRDAGVCAECRLDTNRARKQLQSKAVEWNAREFVASLFIGARAQNDWHSEGSWWQADHIVPVAEGGGGCGLDNLRTLCTLCHNAATAALRARLARARRDARPLPLFDRAARGSP